MDIKQKLTLKVLAALLITVGISGFVLGTVFTYQTNQILARDSFAYSNPVTVDLWKAVPDNSLVPNGWAYLGMVNGKYHYQIQSHNHIMNAGQNWQNSLITGAAGGGRLVYIALGTTAYGAQTDVSLPGGELVAANGNLQRVSAQATNIGAAGSGSLTMTLIETFTATGAVNGVDLAGLFAGTFTQANSPTLWAETTFADLVNFIKGCQSGTVNLASGDTLTIVSGKMLTVKTWTIGHLIMMLGQNVWWSLS